MAFFAQDTLASVSPPARRMAEVECRRLELARLRAERAAISYRQAMVSRRRNRGGPTVHEIAAFRSAVMRAEDELRARIERIGTLDCPTPQSAASLVKDLWEATRIQEEVALLLRGAGALARSLRCARFFSPGNLPSLDRRIAQLEAELGFAVRTEREAW
jgi:hypothetical protein